MKYFITIALMITLIQLTKSVNFENWFFDSDYDSDSAYYDDARLFSYDEEFDKRDDSPKPIYDIDDAPNLFKKFVKDYNKKYEDEKDKNQHYKYFVKSLMEINRINSDKEFSSTADINLFSDYSPSQTDKLLGTVD